MELISQHTKKIMEECKLRARDAGLSFDNETLEYIVTNRDLLELSPKAMIPTMYDYWVHDVEVLKEKGRYELYPGNPYETVINTRPAISFYNDNNPDWLNVMIFYHVLAHIDFFQNNIYFEHTWDYDFTGQALSDKRMISALRSRKGRWVDYVIEFSRGIDNLVGYFSDLARYNAASDYGLSQKVDYYFDVFLQQVRKTRANDYLREVERYNECQHQFGEHGQQAFFAEITRQYPEFESLFGQWKKSHSEEHIDLARFILDHSRFLNSDENKWMKSVVEVVRKTSLFFQPQIRTKIMNEGWASYWHEKLFLSDERISGHEVDYARVNANVTAMPRIGLNPYALGMRLFAFIERQADRGCYSYDYFRIRDAAERKRFDRKTNEGMNTLFHVRRTMSDFSFLNSYTNQEFVDDYDLFVVGKRLNKERMVWEYFVKSRKAEAYREMLLDALYHPPCINVDPVKTGPALYLTHVFEGKPLVRDFIATTMLGIEYLWGNPVKLETSELVTAGTGGNAFAFGAVNAYDSKSDTTDTTLFQRVLYTMENRKLTRVVL